MAENNVEKKTQELVGKIITDLGYELYDIEYLKEGKEYHLCIYIDRPEGISIEDCEKVNNVIDPLLDEANFIKDQYFLEVSSTGLEKNLRKKEHFLKQLGKKIQVKLFTKIDNQNVFEGLLKEYNDDFIILDVENSEIKIEKNKISSAKSLYDWNEK